MCQQQYIFWEAGGLIKKMGGVVEEQRKGSGKGAKQKRKDIRRGAEGELKGRGRGEGGGRGEEGERKVRGR